MLDHGPGSIPQAHGRNAASGPDGIGRRPSCFLDPDAFDPGRRALLRTAKARRVMTAGEASKVVKTSINLNLGSLLSSSRITLEEVPGHAILALSQILVPSQWRRS